MPRLHEIFNTKEDQTQWERKILGWGNKLWKETKIQEPRISKLPDDDDKEWKYADNFISNKKEMRRVFIIFNDEDEACGSVSTYHDIADLNRKILWISNLFVDKEHRSKGLGRFALQYFDQMAIDEKYTAIFIQTIAGNTRASKLYVSHGFGDWAYTRAKFFK